MIKIMNAFTFRKKETRVDRDLILISIIGKGGFSTVWKCNYKNSIYAAKIVDTKKIRDYDRNLIKNEASIC